MKELLFKGAQQMGLILTEKQLEQFQNYCRLLVKWNEKMNLTSITEEAEVVSKHFLDSLAGADAVKEQMSKGALRLIDVGTGAGFPGIPLKILYPQLQVTLLDSLQKRIRFLEEVGRELELTGVDYVHGRAEEVAHQPEQRETYDIAVARAVAPMAVLLEYSAGFVKPEGCFLAYKGPGLPGELEDVTTEWKRLRMNCREIKEAFIPGTELHHFVAVVDKTGELALQYPRKQSKIKKPARENNGKKA